MSDSHELEQLHELITQFPDKYTVDQVEETNRIARTRYEALDNYSIPDIRERFDEDGPSFNIDVCFELCHFFHEKIFYEITSIAGSFRNSRDSKGGNVFFGGPRHGEQRFVFSGSKPKDIKNDLEEAFYFLSKKSKDKALENALRFYQKFVNTHPFYDGNGRVARLFVNLYLLGHNLYIDWKNLQKQGRFLKKLNYYHKTGQEEHFQWWYTFCSNFVYEISEEDEEE